ncbi:MAG: DUF4416 family protein [Candidatus Omnitrophota bacterium]
MGQIRKQQPVKLITGFIFKEEVAFDKARLILERKFGRIDLESLTLPFYQTDYYEKEFGRGLKRKFVSFKKLFCPSVLPGIKIYTNKIEKLYSNGQSRLINIDPGYLDLAKVVLASTKDYKHRIYSDKGIYLEVTLFYSGKSYSPWDWTYPDYRSDDYISVFNQIREIYAQQIKTK